MVKRPEEYIWSSHPCYLEATTRSPWLTMDWALAQFAGQAALAAERFKTFVNEGLEEGHRKDFHSGSFEGRALGDDRFIDRVLLKAEEQRRSAITLEQIIEIVCRIYLLNCALREKRNRPQRHGPSPRA